MPTFLFIKNKVAVATVHLVSFSSPNLSHRLVHFSFAAQTQTASNDSSGPMPLPPHQPGQQVMNPPLMYTALHLLSTLSYLPLQVSLLEFIDLLQTSCLNETADHSLKSIVGGKARNKSQNNWLQSDADEQLLLNISVCLAVLRSEGWTMTSDLV